MDADRKAGREVEIGTLTTFALPGPCAAFGYYKYDDYIEVPSFFFRFLEGERGYVTYVIDMYMASRLLSRCIAPDFTLLSWVRVLMACARVADAEGGDEEAAEGGESERVRRVLSVTGAGIGKKKGKWASSSANRATGTGSYGVHADTRAMRNLKKAIKRGAK